MISVKILRVEPYHPQLGLLMPQIAQRLLDNVKQLGGAGDSGILNLMSRAWAGDPTVLVLACLTDKGQIKGHAISYIDGNQAFLLQPRIDEPTDKDTTGDLIALVEQWIAEYNEAIGIDNLGHIQGITLLAKRADPKWAKKYGFETVLYQMHRKLKGE